jgi:hypothetical protein
MGAIMLLLGPLLSPVAPATPMLLALTPPPPHNASLASLVLSPPLNCGNGHLNPSVAGHTYSCTLGYGNGNISLAAAAISSDATILITTGALPPLPPPPKPPPPPPPHPPPPPPAAKRYMCGPPGPPKCFEFPGGPYSSPSCDGVCHGPSPPHYENPAHGCQAGELKTEITGVPGSVCAPSCAGGQPCPTDRPPGTTAEGQCLLTTGGSPTPSRCVLVCDLGLRCPAGAQCQTIQSTAICTYDGSQPPPPPPPGPPPGPPPPPPGRSITGTWFYMPVHGGRQEVYSIDELSSGSFSVQCITPVPNHWRSGSGTVESNGDLSIRFDTGVSEQGSLDASWATITWHLDGTKWTRAPSPPPPAPSPPHPHTLTGDWLYQPPNGGPEDLYSIDEQANTHFNAIVISGGSGWKNADGVVTGTNVKISFDNGNSNTGTVASLWDRIDWGDQTTWVKRSALVSQKNNTHQLLITAARHRPGTSRWRGSMTTSCTAENKCNATGVGSVTLADVVNVTHNSTLSVLVVAADKKSHSVYTVHLHAATGGCNVALKGVCDAARRQGEYQCANCAGQHMMALHAAGCQQAGIKAFCSNATCVPALNATCGLARNGGTFVCASCIGAHAAILQSAGCTTEQEQTWCGSSPPPHPPPPTPPTCHACNASTPACCNPNAQPPQFCPNGKQCCACGKTSCSC